MKPQDIVFGIVIFFVLYKQMPKLSTAIGLGCLIASIPFFSFWIFFTAQRLVIYAAGFFLVSIILMVKKK